MGASSSLSSSRGRFVPLGASSVTSVPFVTRASGLAGRLDGRAFDSTAEDDGAVNSDCLVSVVTSAGVILGGATPSSF